LELVGINNKIGLTGIKSHLNKLVVPQQKIEYVFSRKI